MKSVTVTFRSTNGTGDFQYIREFHNTSSKAEDCGYSQGHGPGSSFFRVWGGGEFMLVPVDRVISIEGVE